MKKTLILIALLTLGLISCVKERVDEPLNKKEYVTLHWRIDGVEKSGEVYSSIVATTRIEKP